MRILSVVGARPQFIKLAPLSREIRKRGHEEIIVHTGQHYDINLSDIIFSELGLPVPHFNLGVGSGEFGYQVGRMIELLEDVIMRIKPDIVLNYGDTNTTLATAIVSARLKIKQAHIEAGLRCGIKSMPEEQNRIAADHLSNILFAPTPTAINNLKRENVYGKAFLVGDVMVESFRIALPIARGKSNIIQKLNLKKKGFILLTIHRAENTETPETFLNIFDAIRIIGEKVVFPIHPRSQEMLRIWNLNHYIPGNLILVEPVGYLDMLVLEENSSVIMTDSGGVQKEALLAGTPCITLRDVTEWIETIDCGANILVGTKKDSIIKGYERMKGKNGFSIPECFTLNAPELILDILESPEII